MKLSPVARPTSNQPRHPAPEAEHAPAPESPGWRWAVIHFPCLEAATPNGRIIAVSDKKHISEARTKFPDLALWHREELGLVSDLMDRNELDEDAFSRICLLKRKTRGWFLGVDKGKPALTPYTTGGSE